MHARTCGYWYTVTSGSMAHTAFVTLEGLERWARERGLVLPVLSEPGDGESIGGEYRTESHTVLEQFGQIVGEWTRTLSNGDYVDAIISHDDDGVRTVHTLNPNVKTRRVFDYVESRNLMG